KFSKICIVNYQGTKPATAHNCSQPRALTASSRLLLTPLPCLESGNFSLSLFLAPTSGRFVSKGRLVVFFSTGTFCLERSVAEWWASDVLS
ncbi:hypothetical protein NPIL_123691, partial [Nephila pilipes]